MSFRNVLFWKALFPAGADEIGWIFWRSVTLARLEEKLREGHVMHYVDMDSIMPDVGSCFVLAG
jgi:hypothetical protein